MTRWLYTRYRYTNDKSDRLDGRDGIELVRDPNPGNPAPPEIPMGGIIPTCCQDSRGCFYFSRIFNRSYQSSFQKACRKSLSHGDIAARFLKRRPFRRKALPSGPANRHRSPSTAPTATMVNNAVVVPCAVLAVIAVCMFAFMCYWFPRAWAKGQTYDLREYAGRQEPERPRGDLVGAAATVETALGGGSHGMRAPPPRYMPPVTPY